MFSKFLFNIAKKGYLGFVIGFGFQYLSFILPVKKVFESKKVIGFFHPKPSYKEHILIVPKKIIRNLLDLSKPKNIPYFIEIWWAVKEILSKQSGNSEFVVCSNGGSRQDVQQVHFHLFQGSNVIDKYDLCQGGKEVFLSNNFRIIKHPYPNWSIHLVVLPIYLEKDKNRSMKTEICEFLESLIKSLPELNTYFGLGKHGYSIVYQCNKAVKFDTLPIIHIIAGEKLFGI